MHMEHRIYFMYDSCHLVKLIRNHLQLHGFEFREGSKILEADWKYLETFHCTDCSSETRLAPKLTTSHFELTNLTKMKVKLATQIFSNSVSAGIKTLIALKQISPNANGTALFVKKMNDIFDICNISQQTNILEPLKSGERIFDNLTKLKVRHRQFNCAGT